MDSKALINCTDMIDESICTVIILRYKVYRNDSGKIFGKLLTLKHKVESFLKEVFNEEMMFQNPTLQKTKQGLIELIQGLTCLCSGVASSGDILTIPELSLQDTASKEKSYEMKFVKGTSPSDLWLCYVDNGEFLCLLKRLREKYDNDELQPFIFYPRIGEHVYFRQGANIFRGIVLEYVIPDDCKEDDKDDIDVEVKVLNIDNSDVVILPQNCFFQLDDEGIKLPMQCVPCTLQNIDKDLSPNSSNSPSELSLSLLQKYKLNVTFHRKKVSVEGSPTGAQLVTINVSTEKNGLFVPKNAGTRSVCPEGSTQIPPCDCRPNRDDSPASEESYSPSVDDIEEKDIDFEKNKGNICDKIKSSHKNNDVSEIVAMISNVSLEKKLDNEKETCLKDLKISRFEKSKANKLPERPKDSSLNELPTTSLRMKTGGLVATTNPPYHFSPAPPFPSAPVHFTASYMPFSATPPLNPPGPFHHFPQYPYASYIPPAAPPITPQPPGTQQPYFLPPSSSAYQQPFVQPMTPIMSYYPSQPTYSPQFYPAPPSQMPHNWSQMQPSFRVTSPSPVNMTGTKVEMTNAPNVNKSK